MSTRLQQFQSQKTSQEQVLKPQMLQSLKMLALNTLELEVAIKQEIDENPMLELDDDWDDEPQQMEKDKFEEFEKNVAEKETGDTAESDYDMDDELKQTMQEAKELSEVLDSWNEYHNEYSASSSSEHNSDDEEPQFDRFAQAEDNYKLDFINQFDKFRLQDHEYYYIYDLIDSSNAYGFLPRVVDKENDIDEEFDIYALADDYQIDQTRADELHTIVMRGFPRGISARNISECLYHQLETYEQDDPLLSAIILEDFDDLLHKRHQQIARKHDATENDVLDCRERISKLDPKPGLRIGVGRAQYIVPDIIVTMVGEEFEIIINDFNIPKISLSRKYYDILKELKYDKDAVNYVKTKINSAKFLIKSVFMRNRTLERVMRSIINHQRNFFYNNGNLEPLNYAVIAADLGVNESTVSRVVKSKYADTHFGIYCLKDFFCSSAGKDKTAEAVSRQSVQQHVRQLIDSEDTSAPVSDQDIVDILKERGISVSRRVIAKYRDELNIPNSRDRKVVM